MTLLLSFITCSILTKLARSFHLAEVCAKLKLKPSKCKLIPCVFEWFEQVKRVIQQWLAQYIPRFKDFNISICGLYLGFYVGPMSKHVQWSKAVEKWLVRAKAIAASHMSPSLAAITYNIRSLPLLGYIAQLVPTPSGITRTEFHLLHSMMHLPPQSFETSDFYNLSKFGLIDFLSLSGHTLAVRIRAAHFTIKGWRVQHRRLHESALHSEIVMSPR